MIETIDARQDQHWVHAQATLERATQFREDISELLQALNSIARGEGKLIELQGVLTDNLRRPARNQSDRFGSAWIDRGDPLDDVANRQIGLSDSAAA